MSTLKNSRWEKFAQGVIAGRTARAAYVAAGYASTGAGADSSASKLLRNPKVAARIDELKAEAAKASSATATQILDEMCHLGMANILDYLTIDADGLPHVDLSKVTRQQAAAITEITVDEFTDGQGDDARPVRRVRFKLADKRAALVDLGRYFGLFKTKIEHSGPIETKSTDMIDAARRVAWLLQMAVTAQEKEQTQCP